MIKIRNLIKETLIKLLEEDTKFSEGDVITNNNGDEGVITLSKHPFYAVKLDKSGITTSYHFSDINKVIKIFGNDNEEFYGKYNTEPLKELSESKKEKIIHLDGLLIIKDELNITDILSDIRSITGITTVNNVDISGTTDKAKLMIKIDPFPFKKIEEDLKIIKIIKSKIRNIPGVINFWTREDYEDSDN